MKRATAPASPERARDVRAEKIRSDIAKRLRPVCRNLTDEDFCALIERMTKVQLRAERRTY